MLNFTNDVLNLGNTTAFWALKLYYDDESSFIGVSEQDRTIGSDFYHGLVTSWGSYQQSLDFFNFTTSTGNMTVKLINTHRSYNNGRFSDLTNNFANRKWELYVGTAGSSLELLASGVVSGDYSFDEKSITLTLLDYSSKYHKRIPQAVVQNTESGDDYYYPNAPEKNIGKPIPMAYGDFHDRDDVGTIPALFGYYFTKAKFPAIITNSMNEDDGYVYADADSIALNTLDSDNIFLVNSSNFIACSSTNTDIDNPQIKAYGNTWYLYVPLNAQENALVDNNFSTGYELEVVGFEDEDTTILSVPEIPNMGEITAVDFIVEYGSESIGSDHEFKIFGTNANNGGTPKTVVSASQSDIGGTGSILLGENGAGAGDITIEEIGIRVTFQPSKTFTKQFTEEYEVRRYIHGGQGAEVPTEHIPSVGETITKTRTYQKSAPAEIEYIYYSGKGREYGAWIDADSRNQGYNSGALIENPVFMIEDMLRNELSLTSSEIDYDSFDTSGDSSSGDIGDILNDAVGDIQFAFAQYKFIDSKDFIEKVSSLIMSWVFIDGQGKFKIKTLRPSYSDSDKVVDYYDIDLKSISKTTLNAIRNNILIKYKYDYGQDQNLGEVKVEDATSQGSTSDGYNQELKLVVDADIIQDDTTAEKLADAYLDIFKDRKNLIEFTTKRPKYLDLEIGDIIEFSNWDTNIKVYGTAMGGYWMITDISKKPKGCSIKGIQV